MSKTDAPQTTAWTKPELKNIGKLTDVAGRQGGARQSGFKS